MTNFLNKLGDMAKNAADKGGDVIEISRLNAKISTEQTNIVTVKQKIGDFYYERFGTDIEYPAEVTELCQQIKLCEDTIAALQEEIGVLKGESPSESEGKCPACGASNSLGTKFCGECGAKL